MFARDTKGKNENTDKTSVTPSFLFSVSFFSALTVSYDSLAVAPEDIWQNVIVMLPQKGEKW